MFRRTIWSSARDSSLQLVTCLSTFLELELLYPGPEFYLTSPWLSSFPLIDNRFGQFRPLINETQKKELQLAEILQLLSERGTQVRIMCKPNHSETENFLASLKGKKNIEYCYKTELHAKSLATDNFCVSGSMNFTRTGVQVSMEKVDFSTDPAEVASTLVETRRIWEGLAK